MGNIHVGIVTGLGVEVGAHFVSSFKDKTMKLSQEIIIAEYHIAAECILPALFSVKKTADILLDALALYRSDLCDLCDLLLIPCNSVHIAAHRLTQTFGNRFLPIEKAVFSMIRREGRRGRFLILGTSTTIEAGFYQKGLHQLGYIALTLPAEAQTWLDGFIFNELVRGIMNIGHLQTLRKLESRYLRLLGADHVILACTELCYLTRVFSKSKSYEVNSLQALHDAGLERLQNLLETRSNHANRRTHVLG